ncbi:MAG: amino acid ABC transporter permease [Deltaproteobacteria bacterium]|nr:MAG: amino acid ABC transporter permease [Deltaproteobacteria bacterium]
MWGIYLHNLLDSFPFFLKGLWVTIQISALSLFMSTVCGFFLGIIRSTRTRSINIVLAAYVDIIRGTPFLVQIFIVFFILPEWGIQLDAFTSAVLSLTIYGTAYICEIVSGGIQTIPRGQTEAAVSSGLTWPQQMRYVIVPQALRPILPPLVGQYVLMIKDTAVVSVIGLTDVTRVGWFTVQRIPEGILVFGLVGILYFLICYPLVWFSNRLETMLSTEKSGLG